MKEDIILQKYTRALLEVAEEQNALGKVTADLKRMENYFQQVPELSEYFTSPQVEWKHKLELSQTLTKGLHKLLVNFVKLVMEKERQFILPLVPGEFRRIMELRAKREQAVVTTAITLPGEERKLLEKKLGEIFAKEIVLQNEVEPEIIGGVKIQIGHTIIDGSVQRQLQQLGKLLAQR